MFRVGIDVGGTNTDAVLLKDKEVVAFSKKSTTSDVSIGIQNALQDVLDQAAAAAMSSRAELSQVNIGTTHFINAVIQRKHLDRVAVIRLCGPTTRSLPPFCNFPKDLANLVQGPILYADGGYNFDGTVITETSINQIGAFVREVVEKFGIKNFVVVGVFSAVKSDQELLVGDIIRETAAATSSSCKVSVTLSHTIGSVGLLDRENMSILNESLKRLSGKIIRSFQSVLQKLNLSCRLYFTQNDGTLLDLDSCAKFPVRTFSSGATNSMRGAAFLCNQPNLIVLDIGGTSSDAGLIINSFPKPASAHVSIGGVSTSFSMPEVKSIGLGGGSVINIINNNNDPSTSSVDVTEESVALNLTNKARIFGGDVLTTTDYAVAKGLLQLGDPNNQYQIKSALDANIIKTIEKQIERKLSRLVNEVRVSNDPISVYIVGGGECIVKDLNELAGCSIIKTESNYKAVANAIGAALSEISYTYDTIVDMTDRENALDAIRQECIDKLVKLGGKLDKIRLVDIDEVALPYFPGYVARVIAKSVGEPDNSSFLTSSSSESSVIMTEEELSINEEDEEPKYIDCELNNVVIDTSIVPQQTHIENGLWTLSNYDVHCIAVGCGVLGCGGGGNPNEFKLMLLNLIKSTGRRPVITSSTRLSSSELSNKKKMVIGVGEMGSPTIQHEKITSLHVLENIVKSMIVACSGSEDGVELSADQLTTLSNSQSPAVAAVTSFEIGGGNGLVPLLAGILFNLPTLDCDGMGRAFPELQMLYQFIKGASPLPAVIVDDFGGALIRTEGIATPKDLENVFRNECLSRGCSTGISMSPINLVDVKELTISGSYSRAWHIGHAIIKAQQSISHLKEDPISALCRTVNGKILFTGKVVDVLKRIEGGWSRGYITIEGEEEEEEEVDEKKKKRKAVIELQNEYLTLSIKQESMIDGDIVLASVPDLITLIDRNNFQPVMTDEVRYGLQVDVIVIPAPPQLTTCESLKWVGPQAFGFSHQYESNLIYKELPSLL